MKLASNAVAEVTAKGNVRITASNGDKYKSFLLQNTLFVPKLRTNLLSVAKIVDKDHNVTFTKMRAYIKDVNGAIKFIADREGDLFLVKTEPDVVNAAISIKSEEMEWHILLGLLNRRDLNLMMQKEAVTGLKFKTDVFSSCDTCAAGKITSTPFPKGSQDTSTLFEIVHTDLCGPMRTESNGGARYLLTFTDNFSRWTEIYLLHRKSEITEKFIEYKNYVETHTGMKIKTLQSDNGNEFINSGMDRILKDSGIRNRLTAPYTPQQNGIAERKNRTFIQPARCMLIDSALPASFGGGSSFSSMLHQKSMHRQAIGSPNTVRKMDGQTSRRSTPEKIRNKNISSRQINQ